MCIRGVIATDGRIGSHSKTGERGAAPLWVDQCLPDCVVSERSLSQRKTMSCKSIPYGQMVGHWPTLRND